MALLFTVASTLSTVRPDDSPFIRLSTVAMASTVHKSGNKCLMSFILENGSEKSQQADHTSYNFV